MHQCLIQVKDKTFHAAIILMYGWQQVVAGVGLQGTARRTGGEGGEGTCGETRVLVGWGKVGRKEEGNRGEYRARKKETEREREREKEKRKKERERKSRGGGRKRERARKQSGGKKGEREKERRV